MLQNLPKAQKPAAADIPGTGDRRAKMMLGDPRNILSLHVDDDRFFPTLAQVLDFYSLDRT